MSNQITWEKKGVVSCYQGLFTPEIHSEGLNALFGDARIDNIKYIIGDYSQVNGDLLTEEYVDYPVAMTAGAASYLNHVKVALIATDPKIMQLCQLFIELSNTINPTWETRIFADIESARDWIATSIKS